MSLIIYDTNTLRATQFYPSGGYHRPDYLNRVDVDFDADLSQVSGDFKYWKRAAGLWVMQTAQEQVATDAAIALIILTTSRSGADAIKDVSDQDGIQWRALALMLLDEFNTLRQWTVSFKAEVAAATNLADLKTRVATLPTLNDRTITQVKAAYSNKISGGSAD